MNACVCVFGGGMTLFIFSVGVFMISSFTEISFEVDNTHHYIRPDKGADILIYKQGVSSICHPVGDNPYLFLSDAMLN